MTPRDAPSLSVLALTDIGLVASTRHWSIPPLQPAADGAAPQPVAAVTAAPAPCDDNLAAVAWTGVMGALCSLLFIFLRKSGKIQYLVCKSVIVNSQLLLHFHHSRVLKCGLMIFHALLEIKVISHFHSCLQMGAQHRKGKVFPVLIFSPHDHLQPRICAFFFSGIVAAFTVAPD